MERIMFYFRKQKIIKEWGGDTGLNTGGMGAVSPVPFAHETLCKRLLKE